MSAYEFIPYSAGGGGGGGIGSVFTDVTEFPTENVDKSVIYRAQEHGEPVVYLASPAGYESFTDFFSEELGGAPVTAEIHVVETLPDSLEPVIMDLNNLAAGAHIPLYIIESTGQVYMCADPTEDPQTYPNGGWVDSVDDITSYTGNAPMTYVLRGASYPVYGVPSDIRVLKNGVWGSVSTDGDGVLSLHKKTFSGLKSAMDNAARVPMFYRCVCDGKVKLTFADGTTEELNGVFNEMDIMELHGDNGIQTTPAFMQNILGGGAILFYDSNVNKIVGMYVDGGAEGKEVTSVDESGISNITLYYFG